MRKCGNIFPNMRRPLVIYDFATAPFWISLYMRKIWFSFLSVWMIMISCLEKNYILVLQCSVMEKFTEVFSKSCGVQCTFLFLMVEEGVRWRQKLIYLKENRHSGWMIMIHVWEKPMYLSLSHGWRGSKM